MPAGLENYSVRAANGLSTLGKRQVSCRKNAKGKGACFDADFLELNLYGKYSTGRATSCTEPWTARML